MLQIKQKTQPCRCLRAPHSHPSSPAARRWPRRVSRIVIDSSSPARFTDYPIQSCIRSSCLLTLLSRVLQRVSSLKRLGSTPSPQRKASGRLNSRLSSGGVDSLPPAARRHQGVCRQDRSDALLEALGVKRGQTSSSVAVTGSSCCAWLAVSLCRSTSVSL